MNYLLKFILVIYLLCIHQNSIANSRANLDSFVSVINAYSSQYQVNQNNDLFDSLLVYRVQNNYQSYCNLLIRLNKKSNSISDLIYESRLDSSYNFLYNYKSIKDRNKARYTYADRAFAYNKKSKYNEALLFFEKAHSVLEDQSKGDNLTPYIENEIGNIYTRLGDYERAEYYFKFTERYILNSHKTSLLPDVYVNLARLYKSKLVYSKSLEYLKKVGFLENKTIDEKLANYLNFTEVYLELDSTELAEKSIESCNSLISEANSKRKLQFNRLKAKLHSKQGNYDKANKYFERSIYLYRSYSENLYSREFAKLLQDKAKNYILWNRLELATKVINKALYFLNPSIDSFGQNEIEVYQIYGENTFIDLLELKALICERRFIESADYSYLVSALNFYEKAIEANDKLRYIYLLNGSKLLSVTENKTLINKCIDIVYQLYVKSKERKYLTKARELFSHSKSIILIDDLKESKRIGLLSKVERDSIWTLKNKLRELNAIDKIDSLSKTDIKEKYFLIHEEISHILDKENGQYVAQNIQGKYIEYCLTSNYLFSLNNFNDSLSLVRNCSLYSLDTFINEFNKSIDKQSNISDLKDLLNRFYNKLFIGIDKLPKKFTIISDGILAAFPFECLVPDKVRFDYLVNYSELSYALHYSNFFLNENRVSKKKNSILIHSPVYKKKSTNQYATLERDELYFLNYGEEEVGVIAGYFKNSSVIREDLSVASLNVSLFGKSIYHYTGHAKVIGDHSYLTISDDKDLWIRDDEVADMDLDLDLVTLSACETGLGKFNYGEGVQSVGRGFLTAGAKSVVYSLWTVNDQWTNKLMDSFYRFLTMGDTKSNSLRKAKLHYLNTSPPLERHPYYWAGFVLAGDSNALESVESKSDILNVIGVLLILLFTIFYFKKKKIKLK